MTTTTTTKYELTDADRERLDAIAQRANGKPKVNDIAWEVARDWFATLPVVSREGVDRALGEATDEELERFDNQLVLHRGDGTEDDWRESLRLALSDFVAHRDMLDDATGGPPKVEPTPEPQPASRITTTEFRELQDSIESLRRTANITIEVQAKHRGTMLECSRLLELQSECLDDFRRRLNALEFAAQRKPWWRWW